MKFEVESFLDYMQETKMLSENTRVSYRRDLNKLGRYLETKGVQRPADITVTLLESYVLYLEQEGFAASSVSRMLASMKAYFRYLLQNGTISYDCAQQIKAPKVEKKEKEQLSAEEVFRLLDQPSKETDKGIRDRAMMELLYATGIRVSDLISLKMDDLNLKLGCVTCRQKTISFGRETQVALARYISGVREHFIKEWDTGLLFLNCSGGGMSRQGFWKLMKAYAKAAGIEKEITSNMIRKI